MKLVDIGFGNMLSAERIITLCCPDSSPMKRLIQDAKEASLLIDATCGKKTLCVIVTDSSHVVLSSLSPEQIGENIAGLV